MTYEDAASHHYALSYVAASRELKNHSMDCREGNRPGYIEVRSWEGEPWEYIRCTSKAILEWLGY